jgi:hypothetical protein
MEALKLIAKVHFIAADQSRETKSVDHGIEREYKVRRIPKDLAPAPKECRMPRDGGNFNETEDVRYYDVNFNRLSDLYPTTMPRVVSLSILKGEEECSSRERNCAERCCDLVGGSAASLGEALLRRGERLGGGAVISGISRGIAGVVSHLTVGVDGNLVFGTANDLALVRAGRCCTGLLRTTAALWRGRTAGVLLFVAILGFVVVGLDRVCRSGSLGANSSRRSEHSAR